MKIAIVNDSPLAREALRRAIATTQDHEIVWIARDGREAVIACAVQRPDLILMDLMMPVMDGVEATRQIMAETPCPILIVTASVNGRTGKVFEALGAGAFDAVSTPLSEGLGTDALLSKLRTLHLLIGNPDIAPARMRLGKEEGAKEPLILIGASAGGPAALAVILRSLPRDFSCSIVIAQHVDAQFADPMAHWLNEQSALPVRVAIEGERPQPGHALLAGQNAHLTFCASGRLSYRRELKESLYCPSIDLFFESVIGHWEGKISAVLLTGMGSDGARGLKALKESGAFTIAQDKSTSVVFGMPKRAISLGAATEVLPLEQIAPALSQFAVRSLGRCSISPEGY